MRIGVELMEMDELAEKRFKLFLVWCGIGTLFLFLAIGWMGIVVGFAFSNAIILAMPRDGKI